MKWCRGSLWLLWILFVGLHLGCGVDAPLRSLEPALLVTADTPLEFPPTYLGSTSTRTITVANAGEATGTVASSPPFPFALKDASLTLAGSATASFTLVFSPQQSGSASAIWPVGGLTIELTGEGIAVPECSTPDPCHSATFDVDAAQCRVSALADGTACPERCVNDGQCAAGTCVGTAKDCSDADACTVDGCDQSGCTHQPRICPAPTGPCQVAKCDSATGCGQEDVPDGTLCGPDVCGANSVLVCIGGSCVDRPRPNAGRCSTAPVPPGRKGLAMAFDQVQKRVLAFGGLTDRAELSAETWEWDGTGWLKQEPPLSPPARFYHALAYDSARSRIVLFGGATETGPLADTWEWDGSAWLQRKSVLNPPAQSGHCLAYDSGRKRVVLVGWKGNNAEVDTWEWDGAQWHQRTPATKPPARVSGALAYDSARQRVVLFGGNFAGTLRADTWEWDGTNWTQQFPGNAPSPRWLHAMAYDALRQRVILFGSDTESGDTWAWDGRSWVQEASIVSPPGRSSHALAYDATRGRLVLFGGFAHQPLADTWEWAASQWAMVAPPL